MTGSHLLFPDPPFYYAREGIRSLAPPNIDGMKSLTIFGREIPNLASSKLDARFESGERYIARNELDKHLKVYDEARGLRNELERLLDTLQPSMDAVLDSLIATPERSSVGVVEFEAVSRSMMDIVSGLRSHELHHNIHKRLVRAIERHEADLADAERALNEYNVATRDSSAEGVNE